jgi:6-phosphofructokinase 1
VPDTPPTFGILTAGGDCPGLNAALKATAGALAGRGARVIGFEDGFAGLAEGRARELTSGELRAAAARGGSILGCSGLNPFAASESAAAAQAVARTYGLTSLIVVGGNTSMSTALAAERAGIPVIGIPKTIDNDVPLTEACIGFATAVDTATEALDRLQTTAESHDRIMIVEVMGRDAGWVAAAAGIAGGADVILVPERPIRIGEVADRMARLRRSGRTHALIVVGEGCRFEGEEAQTGRRPLPGGPLLLGGIGRRLAEALEAASRLPSRVTVLGHLLRGGPPGAADRLLALRFGLAAADAAAAGRRGVMVALVDSRLVLEDLERAGRGAKTLDANMLDLMDRALG